MTATRVDDVGRVNYNLQVEWKTVKRVALLGKMHSGKSSVASVLVNNGYSRLAFAEELKDISATMLNSLQISIMQHLGQKWKNITREDLDKKKPQLRPFWQFIGAWGRATYGEDVWIKVFDDRYSNLLVSKRSTLVLDDLRYLNEADHLRKTGWTIIRVDRPENDRLNSIRGDFRRIHGRDIKKRELKNILSHESEAEVDDIKADVTILNNGSLAELKRVAAKLAGSPALKRG